MATGFGVGLDSLGSGTRPEDIQRITSAEYIWAGIINRCNVTKTSGMKYHIDGGAAVISIGEFAKVKVPIFAQDIITEPAPVTGSRTDIVYVHQNLPSVEGNNAVVLGVAQTLPPNSLELARFTMPAGATSTQQAVSIGNPIYTRPVGGQFGELHKSIDSDGSVHTPSQLITRGNGRFNLWTDSDVEIKLSSCISAVNMAADHYGSVIYKIYVDGNLLRSWERRFDRVWESKEFSQIVQLDAGTHDVYYTAQTRWYPSGMTGEWQVRHGGAEKWTGDDFRVFHRGVATL